MRTSLMPEVHRKADRRGEIPDFLGSHNPACANICAATGEPDVVQSSRTLSRRPGSLATGHRSPIADCCLLLTLLLLLMASASARAEAPFVQLDSPATTVGYLASLLINEVPFPGERGYESEADTRAAMLQILWVLDSRIHQIPPGYLQRHVAGVTSQDIIDIITGTGGRRQCEGFYRNASGQFVTDQRVQERIQNLLRIANSGGKPGHFAGLLNHAQGLACAYVKGGVQEADRYAGLKQVGPVRVTGHAYAWMTDVDANHPGGNFVTIPDNDDGSLGGNRFFTLKEVAK